MAGRFLVSSDVDGTLLGDHAALVALAEWFKPRRAQIKLAYNSGRSIASLRESIETTPLPEPDALVGNVGSEIECFQSGQSLGAWPEFNGSWDPARVKQTLMDFSVLELQPEIFQSPLKVSYFVYDAEPDDLLVWQAALESVNLNAQLVYSSDRDLDVLPAGVNKGSATRHLTNHWQIQQERVIVCGDSGNDITMFEQGFLGVVVGNALPELAALNSPRVYHAEGEIAAGVQEGLEYWMARIEAGLAVAL